MTWRLSRSDVLFGLECGRLDRSAIPAGPSALNRAAHLRAVTVETMNIFAASDGFQPSSTINLASRKPSFRGQGSISVGHEGLPAVKRFIDSSTSQPEAFTHQQISAVSRNNVPEHHN